MEKRLLAGNAGAGVQSEDLVSAPDPTEHGTEVGQNED